MLAIMRKKSEKNHESGDRHLPFKQTRVREQLAIALEKFCEKKAMSFPQAVNQAVREMLEKEGMWPPLK